MKTEPPFAPQYAQPHQPLEKEKNQRHADLQNQNSVQSVEKKQTSQKSTPRQEPIDYDGLGFKCGLEIHQRLNTGHKLFCRCSANPPEEEKNGQLVRRLRAVAGELGQVDPAAAFEAAKRQQFLYDLYPNGSCLIEQDEEPPLGMNPSALKATIQVCNALGARVLDEAHVMRKTVADGSAVSAFQRTTLIGVNGELKTEDGPVGIATVCVEEESSGIVEKSAGQSEYRLDRLGIPLVEIATEASLKNPTQVQEAAETIGLLLRASPFAQRGIGTIRQDVNISISGGARVEIKGAQELAEVPSLVENEVRRQQGLLAIQSEMRRRGWTHVAFGKPHSVSSIFLKAKPFLSEPLKNGQVALCIKLLFCKGLLGRELMPSHRFGSELADYARQTGVKGIVHCDENPANYGLSQNDFDAISTELSCIQDDGWVVVVAEESRALAALKSVFDRAFFEGIPKETRRADGAISRFMRPLPGAARMYPETDVLPVRLTDAYVRSVGTLETFEKRKADLMQAGLVAEMAEKILRSPEAHVFSKWVEAGFGDAKTLAWALTDVKTTLRRDGVLKPRIEEALLLLKTEKITKSAVLDLLKLGAKEPGVELEKLANQANLLRIRGGALEKLAQSENNDFAQLMRKYRLQVDAAELQKLISKK